MATIATAAPRTLESLKAEVGDRFQGFPPRLQSAARYLVDHPNAAAVDTITALADAAGLHATFLALSLPMLVLGIIAIFLPALRDLDRPGSTQ